MWGGIVGLIIQLIAGGVGGNIAGSALKQYDLGAVGNTIAGIIGGGVGAQIVGALVGGGRELPLRERVASISARLSVRSLPAGSAEAS
jgi:uncharacterized membrane protein YeaQ/YmgE (transglycosylase-associated protein family)